MNNTEIICLIIASIIAALAIVALVMRFVLLVKYWVLNKKEAATGISARDVARKFLDENGMQDVRVEKVGFFRMLFFGNHYSVMKKTIYLRKSIIYKNSITAISVALQKVGLAMQHKNKEKGFMTRYVFQILSFFSPLIFYSIVIAGVVIDFVSGFTGTASIVAIIVAFAYYLLVFFCLLFTIKVESRANKQSIYMIENSQILSEVDVRLAKELLDTYVIIDILDFVISIMKIFYYIIKFFSKFKRVK